MAAEPVGSAGAAGWVDAHHHVWDLAVRDPAWLRTPDNAPLHRTFTLDDLRPLTQAAGVTRTVLVQTVDELAETREFLALADDDPLVAAVTGWVDLTAPDAGDQVAALRDGVGGAYLRGIRHGVQSEPDPDWLDRADVRGGLAAVGAAGLVYELLTLPHQLPAAIRTVRALDDQPFVLDHCSKPPIASGELEPWASRVRALASAPNVTCKLSGLVTEADHRHWTTASLRPYVEVVLEAFGTDRLLFGSDWPVALLAAPYDRWATAAAELLADLSPAERGAVFGDNARRVYALA